MTYTPTSHNGLTSASPSAAKLAKDMTTNPRARRVSPQPNLDGVEGFLFLVASATQKEASSGAKMKMANAFID